MGSLINYLLSLVWPSKNSSDLAVSQRLLQSLPLKPSTRYFTFALRDPEKADSVVYIFSALLLSEQSSSDARDLINTVKPGAVIVQVGGDALEVEQLHASYHANFEIYPKSALHIIKESFHNGNSHDKYMKLAQADVVKAIFGTTFTGHVMAAKQASEEVKSSFYYLERPASPLNDDNSEEPFDSNHPMAIAKHVAASLGNSLFFQSSLGSSSLRFDSPGLKLIDSHLMSSIQDTIATASSLAGSNEPVDKDKHETAMEYNCPEFAQPVYPFLADLYNTYKDLPGMSLALQGTQKLLIDVEDGKAVHESELSICQCFRLAVEGLRVALSSSAQSPLRVEKAVLSTEQFDELPYDEKCSILLVQAIKQQLQRSQTVVAILDAGTLVGIRKHWLASVPDDVRALAIECLISEDTDVEGDGSSSKTRMIDKPIIVVGAGAAAAFGLASLSHWGSASTAMKILTFKIPTIVKVGLLQTKKGAAVVLGKAVSPVVNLFVPSGKGLMTAKSVLGSQASFMKAVATPANIRSAAHGVITTAERASLSAMRTAFYNAMRNRHRKGVTGRPWLSFGASVAACAGLLAFGGGIENVIEVIPEAASIARLCQGVNSLCHASSSLKQVEDAHYWDSMYNRLYTRFTHTK